MNVFYLDGDPKISAQMHADKHVVKMLVEYGQMMSTAHRVQDGKAYLDKTRLGHKIRRWRLDDEREHILYKATHVNHPSNIWLRQSKENYMWLFVLWGYLHVEYEQRYGKQHKGLELYPYVKNPPQFILLEGWSEPPLAMPDIYKIEGKTVESYRNFYNKSKSRFATWKNEQPEWFRPLLSESNVMEANT